LMAILLSAISFAGFAGGVVAQSQANVKTIYVGSEQVDCTGVGRGPQKCYQYKEDFNDSWQLLYGQIEGFDEYEEGFVYQLQVEVTDVPGTSGEVTSKKYKLVRILSKLPASPPSPEQNSLPASIIAKNWSLVTL